MSEDSKKPLSSTDRRDLMANERTFLAWIRTSIGIMAFGFVVEKFELFIKKIAYYFGSDRYSNSNFDLPSSSIFGIGLVGIGALLGLFSFISFKKTEKEIEENNYKYSSVLPLLTTILVVLMGIFLVAYLLYA